MNEQLYGMTYDAILSHPVFRHDDDVRWPPVSHLGAFTQGWRDATTRERDYTDSTLRRLTWCNVGWRMGEIHGAARIDEIHNAFAWLSERWYERDQARWQATHS